MTIETKASINFADINAVEFHCKQCGAILIRKLDEMLRVPRACGNCDAQWNFADGPEGQELLRFFRRLLAYRSIGFAFDLRLQVVGLDEELKKKS